MSNPTFRSGPITFEAAAKLEKFSVIQAPTTSPVATTPSSDYAP